MQVYTVGGFVRDQLLGLDPNDVDYVVVGSSRSEMVSKGFLPVGNDFEVFLHPKTKDEYALARLERNTGNSYTDFDCVYDNVTLEDDLLRRDLTINSIALDCTTGKLVDPYGGVRDLHNKLLHPTSEAFKEDSVRVLRAARFNARFPDFSYSVKLQEYCDQMYVTGALDFLTPERVFKELDKALATEKPSIFFEKLRPYRLFQELSVLWGVAQKPEHHPEVCCWKHVMLVTDYAAKTYKDKEITFAALLHDTGKPPSSKQHGNFYNHEEAGLPFIESFCIKWKVPNGYRDLALMVCKQHTRVHGCLGRGANKGMRPKSIYKLFQETNALAKPERFEKMLKACRADAAGRGATPEQIKEFENKPYPQTEYLTECLQAAKMVNTKEVSLPAIEKGKAGIEIGEAIRVARIEAIRGVQRVWKNKV